MNPLVMGLPAGSELIILALVALVLFGGTKIAGFGKNAGRAIREFKEESQIGAGKTANGATVADPATPSSAPVVETVDAELMDDQARPLDRPNTQA